MKGHSDIRLMENVDKERFFEVFEKVNRLKPIKYNETKKPLTEATLQLNEREKIIGSFIDSVNEYLELVQDKPDITMSYDENEAANMASFGKYTPDDGKIIVVALNRNLADVLRTLAHEMVHFKQNCEGRLQAGSGDDGTEAENEANAKAAIIMREFGRNNPVIFE